MLLGVNSDVGTDKIFEAINEISLRIVAVSKSKPELLSTAVAKAKFKI